MIYNIQIYTDIGGRFSLTESGCYFTHTSSVKNGECQMVGTSKDHSDGRLHPDWYFKGEALKYGE